MNSSLNKSYVNKWRLISDGDKDGFYNMAADEALLYSLENQPSPPTLRIYGWERPTMTVGYTQNIEETIDIEYCLQNDIDIVRRITGGRGIFHQGELTYSIAAPKDIFIDDSISAIYGVIKDILMEAFTSLSIPVDISAEKKKGIGGGACFGAAYRHEITIGGKKIMGGALRRLKKGFLYHGSILLERNSEKLAGVLRFESKKERNSYIDSLNRGVIGINDTMSISVPRSSLENAIVESFQKVLGVNFIKGSMSYEEEELTLKLALDKERNILVG